MLLAVSPARAYDATVDDSPPEAVVSPPESILLRAAAKEPDVFAAAASAFFAEQYSSPDPVDAPPEQQRSLALAILAGLEWAEPALHNVFRLAWHTETSGLQGPPEAAPSDYLLATSSQWRAGGTPPFADLLNAAFEGLGVRPPGSHPIGRYDPELGRAASQENFWGEQPARHEGMRSFQSLSQEERRDIFSAAMDEGLRVEGVPEAERGRWRTAMSLLVQGYDPDTGETSWKSENRDLNPFMLAGEAGGRAGTAFRLNSTALGYFQFLSQDAWGSPSAQWNVYHPEGADYAQIMDPVIQVRWFVNAIRRGKHRGNPRGPLSEAHGWGP
ncbi:MAG: hypothetical protein HY554_14135 [Elusimicrobia bacterium]|nr:hypothetical protein [Elusimicrobiota bacterium]